MSEEFINALDALNTLGKKARELKAERDKAIEEADRWSRKVEQLEAENVGFRIQIEGLWLENERLKADKNCYHGDSYYVSGWYCPQCGHFRPLGKPPVYAQSKGATMASNLPPGVTDDQIPGNRPEDLELEAFHEAIDNEIIIKRLTAEQARRIWSMGMAAADRGESKDAIQLAIDVLEDHGLHDEAERLADAALRGIEPASETERLSNLDEDACPLCKARADLEELRSEKNTVEEVMLLLSDENAALHAQAARMRREVKEVAGEVRKAENYAGDDDPSVEKLLTRLSQRLCDIVQKEEGADNE